MIVTVSDYFLDWWIHKSKNKCNSSLSSQAVLYLSRVMTTTWRHVTTAAYSSHVMLTEPSPWQQTHIHQHPRMQECDGVTVLSPQSENWLLMKVWLKQKQSGTETFIHQVSVVLPVNWTWTWTRTRDRHLKTSPWSHFINDTVSQSAT